MRGLVAAWIAGEAIVVWRLVHKDHRMPVPGALLGITGLFAGLMLIGEAIPAAVPLITAGAWGLDIAGLLNVLPAGLQGQIGQAQQAEAQAQAPRSPRSGEAPA